MRLPAQLLSAGPNLRQPSTAFDDDLVAGGLLLVFLSLPDLQPINLPASVHRRRRRS